MQHNSFKTSFTKVAGFTALLLTAFAFTAKAGGDVYEIYLNDKLIIQQAMYKPVDLKTLALTKANINDRLTIRFSHCGKSGQERSITIKDEKGNILKEWKFADNSNVKSGMVIPVKELLQLEKKSNGRAVNLCYTSTEMPKGLVLSALQLDGKSTTYAKPVAKNKE